MAVTILPKTGKPYRTYSLIVLGECIFNEVLGGRHFSIVLYMGASVSGFKQLRLACLMQIILWSFPLALLHLEKYSRSSDLLQNLLKMIWIFGMFVYLEVWRVLWTKLYVTYFVVKGILYMILIFIFRNMDFQPQLKVDITFIRHLAYYMNVIFMVNLGFSLF